MLYHDQLLPPLSMHDMYHVHNIGSELRAFVTNMQLSIHQQSQETVVTLFQKLFMHWFGGFGKDYLKCK